MVIYVPLACKASVNLEQIRRIDRPFIVHLTGFGLSENIESSQDSFF